MFVANTVGNIRLVAVLEVLSQVKPVFVVVLLQIPLLVFQGVLGESAFELCEFAFGSFNVDVEVEAANGR